MRAGSRFVTGVASRTLAAGISLALTLTACSGPRPPLNPPRLVLSTQTDMAIQLFMQATILLSNYYGFKTIRYSEIQERSNRAGFSTLPFMPPETVRATPELVNLANEYEDNPAMLDFIIQKYGYKALVKYYVRTGLRASQLICRNYILGLEESNQYLEFLRKEFGVAYTLATGILELTHANRTIQGAFLVSRSAVDGAVTAYEEYRFMNIDREAARVLVETAQNKYAEYFAQQVDKASNDPNDAAGGYTFSDAIHAVSTIEYQCTREGIRALLNRSINNTPTNLEIDDKSGTVIFKSTLDAEPATGKSDTGTPREKAKTAILGQSDSETATTQKGTKKRPSSGTETKSGGTDTKSGAGNALPAARDILLAYMRTGTAEERRAARQNLQGLLSDPKVKEILPSAVGSNVLIETIINRKGADFDKVRDLLVLLAREKGFIT